MRQRGDGEWTGRRVRKDPATLLLAGFIGSCALGCAHMAPVGADVDAAVRRGREIVMGRDANCLLCHKISATGARFMGNLGPSLDGVGAKFNAAQLRERLMAPERFNPDSIMPAYARTDGLTQVAAAWRGKPMLTPQQIDDTVAFLGSLR